MAGIPSLVFICGGVRSGKSSFAEKKAIAFHKMTGCRLNYLATGIPSDNEMMRRIDKHKQDRLADGLHWKTIEQPVQIEKTINLINDQDIILLDCVTTLLNNELFSSPSDLDESFVLKVEERIVQGIYMLTEQARAVIVVSNEVLSELPFENGLVFKYQKVLGQIHQQLVRIADEAYLVENGIPIRMKGERNPGSGS